MSGYERGLLSAVRESAQLVWLALTPRNDARRIYGLLGEHSCIGEESRFMNLGYWAQPSTRTLDAASRALALLLARTAQLASTDTVLDAGFGFGDQDLLWFERFSPRRIVGVNVTPVQVEVAQRRVAERGCSEWIDLRLGSAVDTGLESGSMDKVLALESAFHFDTRQAFMKEALRVLRPGGVLACADLLPAPGHGLSWLFRNPWQIPRANDYDRHRYQALLEEAGFIDVSVRSIREHVFRPHVAYLRRRLSEPAVVARMNPLMRFASQPVWYSEAVFASLDYVIVHARKP